MLTVEGKVPDQNYWHRVVNVAINQCTYYELATGLSDGLYYKRKLKMELLSKHSYISHN